MGYQYDDMSEAAMQRLLAAMHQQETEDTMTEPVKFVDTNTTGQGGAFIILVLVALTCVTLGGVIALTAHAILPVVFGCALILAGAVHSAVALGVIAAQQH